MGFKDFVVESEGCCFICRHQITNIESPSIHSLHNLAQYLKLDMSKVFTKEGPIPQQLLDSVKKSKLKVELCNECKCMVGKLYKLFRRLEKTEMEVVSCLDLIHEKLVGSGSEGAEQKPIDCEFKTRGVIMNKMDIVNALRLDALQKCSKKLRCSRPRIKTRNLTMQQVNVKKRTLKSKSQANMTAEDIKDSTNTRDETVPDKFSDTGMGISGREHGIETGSTDGEVDHLYEAEDSNDNMSNVGGGGVEVDRIKIEKSLEPESTHHVSTSKSSNRKRKNTEDSKLSESIPDPIKMVGKVGTPQCSINPATGKYKCHLCQREYGKSCTLGRHFRTAHLNVKYKCTVCGNCFAGRQNYDTHYLSSHIGVRFKCTKCSKVFTQNGSLRLHQESVHLGKRFPCEFCSKTFSYSSPSLFLRLVNFEAASSKGGGGNFL